MAEPSIRESLLAAQKQVSQPVAPVQQEAAPAEPAEEVEATQEMPEAPPEHAPEGPEEPQDTAAASRHRDETGRFAKPPEQKVQPGTQAAQPKAPAPSPANEPKPPASWKPAIREHWGKLPPEVRQEVARREGEVAKLLQQAAEHRRAAEGFAKTFEPYRAIIQGDPVQVTGNLLQTAAQLQTGTPLQRAHIVASIISGYGVDPTQVADILEGKQQAQPQQQAQQFRDPRFDTFLAQVQQAQQQRSQVVQQQAAQQLEEFRASHEYVDDVGPLMSRLMRTAREEGQPITMDEAYEQACMLHKDVRPLYLQRKAAHDAANARASTQRARAASSSVRHEPTAPAAGAQSNSLRDTIIASMGAVGRR